jgi:hypothetical protein
LKATILCDYCRNPFQRYPSQRRGKYKFCSVICKAEWQKIHLVGKNNPNYGNHPTSWIKGQNKNNNPSVLKISLKLKGRKLSKESIEKMRRSLKGRQVWNKGKKHSEDARKKMSMRKKELIAKGWKPIGYHGPAWNKGLTKEVNQKLKAISEKISKSIKKAINEGRFNPLQNLTGWVGLQKERHPNWHGGISFEPYSPEFDKLKPQIKQRDGYRCQLCGSPEGLTVHHIDYNKKNNNPSNLITLCFSCNSKVNFNRAYWIDYFRRLVPLQVVQNG